MRVCIRVCVSALLSDSRMHFLWTVALAMDTHMPDYQEDKIACFIKTLIEKRIGTPPL